MKILGKIAVQINPWWFYNKEDLSPKRCTVCFSKNFHDNVRVSDDYGCFAFEKEIICDHCKSMVSYWAYGYYDPYVLPRRFQ